jgi:hypothetical protein
LNAKCPPTEIFGPQSEPETLVQDWLAASENGLCSVLLQYTSPARSEIVPGYCGAVENYEIESISISAADAVENGDPNLKEVTIQGRLEFTLDEDSHTRSEWSILITEIGGKWFVIDGYH